MWSFIHTALAQTNTLGNPIESGEEAVALISVISNWLFAILITIAVIFIILAAFSYLTSAGNSESVAKAHKRLIYSAVAVAVAVLAKGIVLIAGNIVGGKIHF